MFYLETAATTTRVGKAGGYADKKDALDEAVIIAQDLDVPIDIVEMRDADRVYPCGCSNDNECDECLENKE